MNDEPVFRSVGQALYIAYVMEILPPTQKVSTQILIESLREQSGNTEQRMASTLNLGGITPLEFRGQCSMVRAAAERLPEPESAAVRCRYAWRRDTQAAGVMSLSNYLAAHTRIEHEWALRAVVWRIFHRGNQRAADRYSNRDISRETGVSKDLLDRAVGIVRNAAEILQARAEDRLHQRFAENGLVASIETV